MGKSKNQPLEVGSWLFDSDINTVSEAKLSGLAVNLYDGTGKNLNGKTTEGRNIVYLGAMDINTIERGDAGGSIVPLIQTAEIVNNGRPTSYLIPTNINGTPTESGNHWTLTIIDTDGKGNWGMRYVDPAASGKTNEANRVYTALQKDPDIGIKISAPTILSCGQQTDGWACGYITTENAIAIASGQALKPKYNAEDTKALTEEYNKAINPNKENNPSPANKTSKAAADLTGNRSKTMPDNKENNPNPAKEAAAQAPERTAYDFQKDLETLEAQYAAIKKKQSKENISTIANTVDKVVGNIDKAIQGIDFNTATGLLASGINAVKRVSIGVKDLLVGSSKKDKPPVGLHDALTKIKPKHQEELRKIEELIKKIAKQEAAFEEKEQAQKAKEESKHKGNEKKANGFKIPAAKGKEELDDELGGKDAKEQAREIMRDSKMAPASTKSTTAPAPIAVGNKDNGKEIKI